MSVLDFFSSSSLDKSISFIKQKHPILLFLFKNSLENTIQIFYKRIGIGVFLSSTLRKTSHRHNQRSSFFFFFFLIFFFSSKDYDPCGGGGVVVVVSLLWHSIMFWDL